ncbi:MAG: T9SS type A sorting domain-containing protein [Bacteroidetes bacterium]|nr:T9SS type A sorting domain-containing protein [Bacteroidota bacterium]
MILKETLSGSANFNLDTKALSSGMYFLTLKQEQLSSTKKITVQ